MRGNLYSRKRVKLPNFRELHSIKAILLIMLATIIISIGFFLKTAYPVFKATCETAASSKGVTIINEEVNKVMRNYSYDNLISVEKDQNGKIAFIKADSICINDIVTKIVSNIQKQFDGIPRINVFINMGSVSGISALKNIEPKFEVELESAGNINATVRTDFQSIGINQTHHKIYLDIDARVGILTPLDTFGKDVSTEVLLTEAVIVGEVPDSYYNLSGFDEPSETYNFVE